MDNAVAYELLQKHREQYLDLCAYLRHTLLIFRCWDFDIQGDCVAEAQKLAGRAIEVLDEGIAEIMRGDKD